MIASSLARAETEEVQVNNGQNPESDNVMEIFSDAVRKFRRSELTVESNSFALPLSTSQQVIDAEGIFESPAIFEEEKEEDHLTSYKNQEEKSVESWLNGMAIFAASGIAGMASRSSIFPTIVTAGLISSSSSPAEAVIVGNENYPTAVYCGTTVDCSYLRDAAKDKSKKLKLIEVGQGKSIKGPYKKIKRLISPNHADKHGKQMLALDLVMRPDDLAKRYCPNAVAIHAIGCEIGSNPEQNFGQNSLGPSQVLFLYGGNRTIAESNVKRISSFLALEPNSKFPPTEIIHVVSKQGTSKKPSSIFAKLSPFPLPMLTYAIEKGAQIDQLYNLMAQYVMRQKEEALKTPNNSEAKKLIAGELERLGFRDFAADIDFSTKSMLVQDYLWHLCYSHAASYQRPLPSELRYFQAAIKSGFVDVNYETEGGYTISFAAAEHNQPAYLAISINNKTDLNKANRNGETPTAIATWKGYKECLKILLDNEADPKIAANDGTTPLHLAAQNGRYESVEILARKKADLDQPNKSGVTPLMLAIYVYNIGPNSAQKKTILSLIEHGANPELKIPHKPHETAYIFAGKDQALVKEMKEARSKYLKSEKENKKTPSDEVKNPISAPLKDNEVGEVTMGL
jgi:hypothetical protein